jgi:hypothetical protein
LRAKGVTSRICGLSANDAEAQFLDAGADYFLFKPFPCEKETLHRALLKVLFEPSSMSKNHVMQDLFSDGDNDMTAPVTFPPKAA